METIVIKSLADSVDYMLADDYRCRLVAEYAQLEIRMSRLADTINDNCEQLTVAEYEELKNQYLYMSRYHEVLNKRLNHIKVNVIVLF